MIRSVVNVETNHFYILNLCVPHISLSKIDFTIIMLRLMYAMSKIL